jgi:hypothetical protein
MPGGFKAPPTKNNKRLSKPALKDIEIEKSIALSLLL